MSTITYLDPSHAPTLTAPGRGAASQPITLDELAHLTLDSVNARRNQLLGLWAGQRLGLHGEELVRYVLEVMDSDRLEPGPADIVAKVTNDLREIGVLTTPREVLVRLCHLEAAARGELMATD
jgi:hypothetical protein